MQSKSSARLTRTQRARRADIIAAAITVLDREGFAAASVERIARQAEATKSTVLYHFGAKEAIYQAVVAALYDAGGTYMTERILAADSYRDKLRAYLDSNLRFIAEHAAHVRAVRRILENANPDGSPADPGYDDVAGPLALLRAGQSAGEFGPFDPLVVALVLRAVVDGAANYFTTHPDLDVEHYIAEGVALFDRATAPPH